MPLSTFIPSRHGFHFVNDFVNHPFQGIPLLGLIESQGLCGGMPLAALRYYLSGIPIPNHKSEDFAPFNVPPEGSRLYKYLYDRQIEAFGPLGLASTIQWRTMPWVTLEEQFRWSFTDPDCEFGKIVKSINTDMPVIIGLRQSEGFGSLHAVLAIGYDDSPRRVYVYDSNEPDSIMELRADNRAQRISYQVRGAAPGSKEWASFFITGATAIGSPPTYIDLAVQYGIEITTKSSPALFGEQATISATAHNFGDYPVSIRRFILSMTDPSGVTVELYTSQASVPIHPGKDYHVISSIPKLGSTEGYHSIFARYETNNRHIINMPAIDGGQNPATIYLGGKDTKPKCKALKIAIEKQLAIISNIEELGIPDGKEGAKRQKQLLDAQAELRKLRQKYAELGCSIREIEDEVVRP